MFLYTAGLIPSQYVGKLTSLCDSYSLINFLQMIFTVYSVMKSLAAIFLLESPMAVKRAISL